LSQLKASKTDSLAEIQSTILYIFHQEQTPYSKFTLLANQLLCSLEHINYGHSTLAAPDSMIKIPTLMILDAESPRAIGLATEFLKRMRQDPRLVAIPMIIVTTSNDHFNQIQFSHLGCDDFIEADAPFEVILSRVRAQLRHSLAAQRLERVAIESDLFAAGVLYDIAFTKTNIVNVSRQIQGLIHKDLLGSIPQIKAHLLKLKDLGSGLGIYASDVIQSLKDGTREPRFAPMKLSYIVEWYQQTQLSESPKSGPRITFQMENTGVEPEFLGDQSFLKVVLLNIVKLFSDLHRETNQEVVFKIRQNILEIEDDAGVGSLFCRNLFRGDRSLLTDHTLDLLTNLQQGIYSDYHGTIASWTLARKVAQKMRGRLWLEKPKSLGQSSEGITIGLDFPII
jgi:CheY-like chemotaxis protein